MNTESFKIGFMVARYLSPRTRELIIQELNLIDVSALPVPHGIIDFGSGFAQRVVNDSELEQTCKAIAQESL